MEDNRRTKVMVTLFSPELPSFFRFFHNLSSMSDRSPVDTWLPHGGGKAARWNLASLFQRNFFCVKEISIRNAHLPLQPMDGLHVIADLIWCE